jgi:hypothetical protein
MNLSDFLFKIDKPILFKNILINENEKCNSAADWTPQILANIFKEKKIEFRIVTTKSSDCKYNNYL